MVPRSSNRVFPFYLLIFLLCCNGAFTLSGKGFNLFKNSKEEKSFLENCNKSDNFTPKPTNKDKSFFDKVKEISDQNYYMTAKKGSFLRK